MKMKLNPAAAALTANTFSNWLLFGMTPQVHAEVTAMFAHHAEHAETEELRSAAAALKELLCTESIEVLAKDWATAFAVGASSTAPYESSVRTGLVMQEPRDATLAWMRRWGVLPDPECAEPEDHLGLQAALFSRLIGLSLEAEDEDQARTAVEAAARFASERLAWISLLLDELKRADAPRSVAGMINFLSLFIASAFDSEA